MVNIIISADLAFGIIDGLGIEIVTKSSQERGDGVRTGEDLDILARNINVVC